MKHSISIIFAVSLSFIYAPALFGATGSADDLLNLRVDLDGDMKPEVINVSTSPAKENWRRTFTVTVSQSHYAAEFYAVDGDIPELQYVAMLDWNRSKRQLLVSSPEPSGCVYHLLVYSSNKLIPLLKTDPDPNCKVPRLGANNSITVVKWEGFWNRSETYRLNSSGTALVPEKKNEYDMWVSGAAGDNLKLEGAECPPRTIAKGVFVRLTRYDKRLDRYRVESVDRACGWVPAKGLDGIIKELPWAG